MILRILTGSVIALGLGFAAESAHAAQTFLCEDGRVLQVKLHDIERMKREVPCVAAAFGLEVKPVPLPVKRPKRTATPVLKGTKTIAKTLSQDIGTLAQTSNNHRRVRIINAQPGSRPWFEHTR